MSSNRRIIILAFVCALLSFRIAAQTNDINLGQISLEEGLSQSTVQAIVQDAQGFIWFGTQDGLNRYDGYSIKVFKHDPKDSNSVSDSRINCLLNDSSGDLWIGTAGGGVDRYVLDEDRFYHYSNDLKNSLSLSNNSVTAVYEDSDENIWVGTNSGLNRYNRKLNTFTRFVFDLKDTSVRNGNSITAVIEDKADNIWIGTYKGLYKYNLKNNHGFVRITNLNSDPATLYGDDVTALYIDRSGRLWVGTYDQYLKSYDKRTNSFHKFINTIKAIKTICEDSGGNLWLGSLYMNLRVLNLKTNNVSGIPAIQNDLVNTLYEDKSGTLWIGTSFRGTFIYDKNKNRFNRYLGDPYNPNVVMAILEDGNGGLWVATYGNGLKHFNRKRDKIKTYRHNPDKPESISSDKIFSLCITSDGVLWVGTIGGGLNYLDSAEGTFKGYTQHSPADAGGLSSNDITALYEASDGNLFIGNAAGGIDILNRKTKTFEHYYPEEQGPNTIGAGKSVTVIHEDEKGSIWAGTLDGLKRFEPKLNSFVSYKLRSNGNKKSTNYTGVTSLLFKGNIMWIGTTRNGLLSFNQKSKSLFSYSENDGLPDNIVLGILPDSSGNLWLSTNKGISRFNPADSMFKNYDINDGLQANEFNQGADFKSKTGEMFFGGVNGFNSFYPSEIQDNRHVPPVYLTSFKVFDKKLKLSKALSSLKQIHLSYSENFFSFEFVALNYTSPDKNKYAYKLEGFDKNWHIVSADQRYASYTNLDPGEYVLHVKGSNNDGVWNKTGTSLQIIILPPVWMTWWFKTLGIIIIISTGFFVYQRRFRQLKKDKALQQEISRRLIEKQEEERSRIALEMHDSVGQDLLLIKNHLILTNNKISDRFTIPAEVNSDLENFKLNTSRDLNQISEDISGVLKTVREISHNLRPPDLDQLGLTETIKSILLALRKSTTIKVTGKVENIDEIIPKDLEINLVRILQEALGNVMKHAESTVCSVVVLNQNSCISLEIVDNGIGFDLQRRLYEGKKFDGRQSNTIGTGLGLTGMTERARILGGLLK